MLNGDAHHSFEGEPRLRIRPVALFSKTGTSERIPHGHSSFRLSAGTSLGEDCAAALTESRGERGRVCVGRVRARPRRLWACAFSRTLRVKTFIVRPCSLCV